MFGQAIFWRTLILVLHLLWTILLFFSTLELCKNVSHIIDYSYVCLLHFIYVLQEIFV
jgi:hypothetical protein